MSKKCGRSPNKFAFGVILVSIGVGIILSLLLPFLAPVLALGFIGAGIWILYQSNSY